MIVRKLSVHRLGLCCSIALWSVPTGLSTAAAQTPPTRAVAAPPATARIDVTYVAPEAAVVVVLRPAQILAEPLAELLPIEVASAAGLKHVGIDPAKVSEIIVSIEVPAPAPTPADDAANRGNARPGATMRGRVRSAEQDSDMSGGAMRVEEESLEMGSVGMTPAMAGIPGIPEVKYTVTVKFTQPFNGADIAQATRGRTKPAEISGRRYLQSADASNPLAPSFYAPDSSTLVIAPDAALRRLVQARAQGQAGRAYNRARSAPAGNDVYVVIDVAALRPAIPLATGMAQPILSGAGLPADSQKWQEIRDLILWAEMSFNISGSRPSSVVIQAKDPRSGAQLETLIADSLKASHEALAARVAATTASGDPVDQAKSRYVERVSGRWNEILRPRREGPKLTFFETAPGAASRGQLLVSLLGLGSAGRFNLPTIGGFNTPAAATLPTAAADVRVNSAMAQIRILESAIQRYQFDTSSFPTKLEDLTTRPAGPQRREEGMQREEPERRDERERREEPERRDDAGGSWSGPYVEGMAALLDPWGNRFNYAAPGRHNLDRFDVWSLGPDGQDGTADDIGNWISAAPIASGPGDVGRTPGGAEDGRQGADMARDRDGNPAATERQAEIDRFFGGPARADEGRPDR